VPEKKCNHLGEHGIDADHDDEDDDDKSMKIDSLKRATTFIGFKSKRKDRIRKDLAQKMYAFMTGV